MAGFGCEDWLGIFQFLNFGLQPRPAKRLLNCRAKNQQVFNCNLSGEALKIKLVSGFARNRFYIQQNGRMTEQLPDANLTLILGRLRWWPVLQVNKPRTRTVINHR